MRIVVTGSSSHLCKALLPVLLEHPQVEAVTGIDIKPTKIQHLKFTYVNCDIRDRKIKEIIAGHDALIHTAFVVLRSNLGRQRKNRKLCREINVNGSINVFNAAIKNKLKAIIHVSSASVYGALPGNEEAITEDQPRRVMHGFSYAEDKNAIEDWLESMENETKTRLVRLRPHVVLGPNAQPFLLKLLQQPFYPHLKEPQPLIQAIWETDLADAIIKAVFNANAEGAYNLAGQPPTSFKAMIKANHRWAFPVPFLLSKLIQNIAWIFSSKLEEPGWIDGMQHSLSLNTHKAEKELNWKATKSSLHCAIDVLPK
ncbi:MAG: NAD-dependent epimerase/dehydratase family protein [Gammaproteobacteria bacterium]|nr:NAD-dependent epimerase/dehydratase family protein [Gammaproteobacteria bacterium]